MDKGDYVENLKKYIFIIWLQNFNGLGFFVLNAYHRGLFNANTILVEEQWYFLTHSREDKEVHAFPNGIIPKVNAIARVKFELA